MRSSTLFTFICLLAVVGCASTDDSGYAAAAAPSEDALAMTWEDDALEWGPCPPIFEEAGCTVTVLHGDPAAPNADIFFRVPEGYEIPWHTHTSAERIVAVSGEMEVTYADQAPVTLVPGTYAYGPARKPHEAYCSEGPCVLFIAFEQPIDAFAVPAP
ncbi:MAG: cupin domain-containing protein [Thermoanaerobaculia bacterium]|nr:cupin domain-containing protein [Thermoanaerobaculia bacterium]